MNQAELLRHVAGNLEAGRDEAHGLVKDGAAKDFQGVMLREPRLYSLAPRTRIINGVEVPAPMDKEPKVGDYYWFECALNGMHHDVFGRSEQWCGSSNLEKKLFEAGAIYKTQDDADKNYRARDVS